jgi:acyl dehydratase
MYGGVIASGWLTASLSARQLVLGYMNDTATVGGRGMDDLRWHEPVRAGDELSVEIEVLATRPSDSIPGVGHTETEVRAVNQDGETVLTMVGLGLVETRED